MRPADKKLLIVEDEVDVARLLRFNLGEAGFVTEVAHSGEAALAAFARFSPDVVLLDVMLPDMSGLEVCRRLRQLRGHAEVGIVILTARGDEDDRVDGLEAGADDYVVKPFSVREVVLRTQALARRVGERPDGVPGTSAVLRVGELEVDRATLEVRFAGKELSLRPLELKLLLALMAEPGRVLGRAELLAEVWGLTGESSTRTVDVHIRRLRQSLGDAAELIETVHGFGYRAARI